MVIDTENNGALQIVFCGDRHDHPFGTRFEVDFELVELTESAGALNDIVNSQLAPGKLRGVLLTEYFEWIFVDNHRIPMETDLARVNPVDTVIFEDVGKILWGGQIVNRHHIKVPVHLRNPRHHSTDAAETINGNFWSGHHIPPFVQFSESSIGSSDPSPNKGANRPQSFIEMLLLPANVLLWH